jgi:cysteine desulfurase / selenocysteine lyase
MTGGQMIHRVTLTGASFRAPPRRFEAGTPPIAAAVGLGAASMTMSMRCSRGLKI